jgi:hypothetical protein
MAKHFWILAFLLAATLPVLAEEDLIATKLDSARLKYQEEIERLRTELLVTLQNKEDAARKAGDVAAVDRIKAEREAFNLADDLPLVVSTARYKQGIVKAKSALKTAVQTGVKEYLAAKQDDLAKALQPELEELQVATAPPPKKVKAQKNEPQPYVVCEGVHQATNGGNTILRAEFKLYSNGRINDPESRNTWRQQGRILTMRWQNAEAPGGVWVDIVTLTADGRSFKGKNQVGTTITGFLTLPERESTKRAPKK